MKMPYSCRFLCGGVQTPENAVSGSGDGPTQALQSYIPAAMRKSFSFPTPCHYVLLFVCLRPVKW